MDKIKKKIVIFSGAGLDKESGIETFRDGNNGMWNNHKIEDVATPAGWKKSPESVLQFYNERRRELPNVIPNEAHKGLVSLEENYDVIHVTQNVSDLLEKAGASTVYHLHGELTKARGTYSSRMSRFHDLNEIIDIGYKDIKMGDECELGTQLRPSIVWFGEMPFHVARGTQAIRNADILLIVGTSLQIGYTLDMLQDIKEGCRVIYIDPEPMNYLSNYGMKVEYIREKAEKGVSQFIDNLLENEDKGN